MPEWVSSLVEKWGGLGRSFSHLVTGGEWALEHPEKTRRNLRWFWFDGLFSSASDNIIITYMTLYVLALGATRAQIGIMSALSSLSATLLLLPGALLVERFSHRREITLLFGGGIARLAILLNCLDPFRVERQGAGFDRHGLLHHSRCLCQPGLPSLAFLRG